MLAAASKILFRAAVLGLLLFAVALAVDAGDAPRWVALAVALPSALGWAWTRHCLEVRAAAHPRRRPIIQAEFGRDDA